MSHFRLRMPFQQTLRLIKELPVARVFRTNSNTFTEHTDLRWLDYHAISHGECGRNFLDSNKQGMVKGLKMLFSGRQVVTDGDIRTVI